MKVRQKKRKAVTQIVWFYVNGITFYLLTFASLDGLNFGTKGILRDRLYFCFGRVRFVSQNQNRLIKINQSLLVEKRVHYKEKSANQSLLVEKRVQYKEKSSNQSLLVEKRVMWILGNSWICWNMGMGSLAGFSRYQSLFRS